jgi:transposase InsO family protein
MSLVTEAFPWDEARGHLIRDRDGAFGPAYTRRIRAMGIRDHPTAPRSPWQNGHTERLIRMDSSRMPRSRNRVWRGKLAPCPEDVRCVLQSNPYSSLTG